MKNNAQKLRQALTELKLQETNNPELTPNVRTPFYVEGAYYAVYGSLRHGRGNWNWSFNEMDCEFVQVSVLNGFKKGRGLSAHFTGNPEDKLAIDLFKVNIHAEDFKKFTKAVDGLESCYYNEDGSAEFEGYKLKLVQIPITTGPEKGKVVYAKFYESESRSEGQKNAHGHYDIFGTEKRLIEGHSQNNEYYNA